MFFSLASFFLSFASRKLCLDKVFVFLVLFVLFGIVPVFVLLLKRFEPKRIEKFALTCISLFSLAHLESDEGQQIVFCKTRHFLFDATRKNVRFFSSFAEWLCSTAQFSSALNFALQVFFYSS